MLLINPWINDFAAYDLWMKPLGLLYIARIFKNAGFDIDFIDCLSSKKLTRNYGCGKFNSEEITKPEIYKDIPRAYKRFGITEAEFIKQLKSTKKPDVILVTSFMTYWYLGVFDVIKIVKKVFPKTPIVLGGLYACLCGDHARKFSGASHVYSKTNLKDYYKLICNIAGKDYKANDYPKNFLDYPYPYFEILKDLDYGCILTSVGCTHKCSYCASPCLYPNFVQRRAQEVVSEIEFFHDLLGLKDFAFYDDALLINFDTHLRKIYEGIRKANLKINFHTPNGMHASMISKEVAGILFDMGLKTVRLGFEFNDKLKQEKTGGKINNSILSTAVKNLKEAGFAGNDIGVYVIVGYPGQKLREVLDTIKFVKDLGVKPRINEYSPIPGTKDFSLDTKEDPLLHNNKAFYYLKGCMSLEDMRQVKEFAKI